VLVLIGWAGTPIPERTVDCIELLLREVVLPVCREEGAVVVTGGTDVGVMAAIGRAAAEQEWSPVLVGVAPEALLTGMGAKETEKQAAAPEPFHRLIRTEGDEWGSEGPALVRVAEGVARDRAILVLTIGGGPGTLREVELAARRRWPVLLLTGHGGLSDVLASSLKVKPLRTGKRSVARAKGQRGKPTLKVDLKSGEHTELKVARDRGCQAALPLDDREALERILRWRLRGDDIYKDAWTRFAISDEVATAQKKPTTALAVGVLILATLTLLCALGAGWLGTTTRDYPWAHTVSDILKAFVTALALIAAALLGLMDRRTRTGSWIQLRTAAESLLRHIYRARAGVPADDGGTTSISDLVTAMAAVDHQTSGRALLSAKPYDWRTWPPASLWSRIPLCDTLLCGLTPNLYDQARVLDQLAHYEGRARSYDRNATWLAAAIFAVAGTSAFLLALSWRWGGLAAAAAVPASITAALVSWREYRQRDSRAEVMLTTCVAVRSARARWLAQPIEVRNEAGAVSRFVGEVEAALAEEGSDWERALRQAHMGLIARHRGS
jgi:hypothetical protein